MVIFLTGVGTRSLAAIAEAMISRDQFAAALQRVRVVARGPKPTAALKELGVARECERARTEHLAGTTGGARPRAAAASDARYCA